MILHPYKQGSISAKALAAALGIKIMREAGPVFRNKLLLNWGRSSASERVGPGCQFINLPKAVAIAAHKIKTFKLFSEKGIKHVPWTTDKAAAQAWKDQGHIVLARAVLTGHSGDGITIVRANDDLPDVPLYTLYVKKNEEYRVHIFKGEVLDVQQKKRKNGAEPSLIRSVHNGYVYCREGVVLADEAKDLARAAVNSLGLDFGAVDLIKGKDGQFYALEVNTAPGLEGMTIDSYVAAIKKVTNAS